MLVLPVLAFAGIFALQWRAESDERLPGALWLLAGATVGSGAVHAAMTAHHAREAPALGWAMAVMAVTQLAGVVWLLLAPTRRTVEVGVLGNLSLVVLWTWTRLVGIPFGIAGNRPCPAWHLAPIAMRAATGEILRRFALRSSAGHTRSIPNRGPCILVPRDFQPRRLGPALTRMRLQDRAEDVSRSLTQLVLGSYMVWDARRQRLQITKLGQGQDRKFYYLPNAEARRGQSLRLRLEQDGGRRVLNYVWKIGEEW